MGTGPTFGQPGGVKGHGHSKPERRTVPDIAPMNRRFAKTVNSVRTGKDFKDLNSEARWWIKGLARVRGTTVEEEIANIRSFTDEEWKEQLKVFLKTPPARRKGFRPGR